MLRARFALLTLVSACALAACIGDESPTGTAEQGSIAPTPLAGTYARRVMTIGELVQLVLKTDGTFHWGQVVACAALTSPCDPVQQDGSYRLTQRYTMRFMTFYDHAGAELARYQYELQGDSLRLRRAGTISTWYGMERSDVAWCASPSDCTLQNLHGDPCAGYWSCPKDACIYQCGAIAREPGDNNGG